MVRYRTTPSLSRGALFVLFAMLLLFVGWARSNAAEGRTGNDDLSRLKFMQGTWTCPILRDGKPTGITDHLTYRFFAGGQWMAEHDDYHENGQDASSSQMWGYDPHAGKLVAYQFMKQGIFTKTVYGWQSGEFVSRRNDNGAWVSIRPHSERSFDWIIQPADKSSTIVEACTR